MRLSLILLILLSSAFFVSLRFILTTEMPSTQRESFEIIPALLSRCKIIIFNQLSIDNIKEIIFNALSDKKRGYGLRNIQITNEAIDLIAHLSDGDARKALNIIEQCVNYISIETNYSKINTELIKEMEQKKILTSYKYGEDFYNLTSALHKSIRNSDVDASIYWLTRMIEAGIDPMYIARRLIRIASEDIGNADPQALGLCIAAKEAYHFLGAPEGTLAIVQATIYLAVAPKIQHILLLRKKRICK